MCTERDETTTTSNSYPGPDVHPKVNAIKMLGSQLMISSSFVSQDLEMLSESDNAEFFLKELRRISQRLLHLHNDVIEKRGASSANKKLKIVEVG